MNPVADTSVRALRPKLASASFEPQMEPPKKKSRTEREPWDLRGGRLGQVALAGPGRPVPQRRCLFLLSFFFLQSSAALFKQLGPARRLLSGQEDALPRRALALEELRKPRRKDHLTQYMCQPFFLPKMDEEYRLTKKGRKRARDKWRKKKRKKEEGTTSSK